MSLDYGFGDSCSENWTARRTNQSIMKKINATYCLDLKSSKHKFIYLNYVILETNLKNFLSLAELRQVEKVGRQRRIQNQGYYLNEQLQIIARETLKLKGFHLYSYQDLSLTHWPVCLVSFNSKPNDCKQ